MVEGDSTYPSAVMAGLVREPESMAWGNGERRLVRSRLIFRDEDDPSTDARGARLARRLAIDEAVEPELLARAANAAKR